MNKHQFDVIVVGAGGAGLMAALYASRTAKTAVLSKLISDPLAYRHCPGWRGRGVRQHTKKIIPSGIPTIP